MSRFRAVLSNRDFSGLALAAPATLRVDRFSKHALGGPKKATLIATGAPSAVWEMAEYLRRPVEIFDEYSRPCWWGFVSSVTITQENFSFGVSLEGMSNRIAVAYSLSTPGEMTGGRRATTAWVQDSDSVSAYGKREALLSQGDLSAESADSLRDRALSKLRYPIPEVTPGTTRGKGQVTARIECCGWWDTLEWQYYGCAAGLESNSASGGGSQDVGSGASRKVAQGFQIAAATAWTASTVLIKVKKQGSPTDNITVEIQSSSSGAPSGTVLGSASLAASSIPDNADWITFTLASPVALSPSTAYFLVVTRSGSYDNSNCYRVDMDEGLSYPRGAFLFYDSAWRTRNPDADMQFQVAGTMETGAQIALMLSSAQFVAGFEVAATNLQQSQYRDGDSSVQTEMDALMKVGVSGGSRLLGRVTRERWVQIYPEPAAIDSAASLLLDRAGRFYTRGGVFVPGHLVNPGVWVRMKDLIPDTLDTSRMADPSTFFLDEIEFDAAAGKVTAIPQRAVEAMNTISFAGGA